MGTLADLGRRGGAARLGPRDPDAPGRRRGARRADGHARGAAPPRGGAPGRSATRSPALAGRDDLDDDARGMLRLATRERDRALRVPEALVREISEAWSRCVSAWADARAADDFAAYAGPLGLVVVAEAPRGRGDRASATSPTTRCSTSSSRERAPPTWSPSSPTSARALTPLVAAASERPPVELPPREWSADGPDGHRARDRRAWSASTSRRASSPSRPTPSPARRTAATCASPPASMPDSPIGEHQRGAPRARARPLRAGLPGRGWCARRSTTRPRSAPTSRSRASGRTRSAARPAFWERIEPAMRRIFPEAMSGRGRRPAAPRGAASCAPR